MDTAAFDRGKADELLKIVEQLASKRGLTIPPADPYPDQQDIYERYLKSMGLDSDDVDRVIDMGRIPQQQRAVIHGTILKALINSQSLSDDELKNIILIFRTIFSEQRASGLLRTISSPIYENERKAYPRLNRPLAMGVFPLRWFNGQSLSFERVPICLVATGAFDLIEIFSILFLARQKNPKYAVENMRKTIDHYVRTGAVPKAEYGLARGLVDFGNHGGVQTRLTTAAEQFLISHELGHVALGHIDDAPRGAVPVHARSQSSTWISRLINAPAKTVEQKAISVIQPRHIDEHCADIWALKAMLATTANDNHEGEDPIVCGGAAVFLGLTMICEAASAAAHLEVEDSHPAALNRLYLAELAFELFEQHQNAFVARRVREFVEEIGGVYPKFEMPPLLDRSLNRIAVKVFEKLGIDLSAAHYITDFQ